MIVLSICLIITLANAKKEALNLGLNCHIQKRFDPIDKKIDIEMLYSFLLKLDKKTIKFELTQLSKDN